MNLFRLDAIISGIIDSFKHFSQGSVNPLISSAGHAKWYLTSQTVQIDESGRNIRLKGRMPWGSAQICSCFAPPGNKPLFERGL